MISLIVPVYNVKPYIVEFLDSVVNQTYDDFETILVDDGSTDGTSEILDEYALRHRNIRVIHKENGGVVSAWKRGVYESNGDYITFADPDDILMPNMLSTQFRLLKENDADIVITGINRLEKTKMISMSADNYDLREGVFEGKELEEIKGGLFGTTENAKNIFLFVRWNKLFKKETILNNLKYSNDNISFGEDVCVCASAFYDAKKLYYSHEPLYVYRIRENSLTTKSFSFKEIDDAQLLIDSVRKLLSDKGYMNDFIYYNDPTYHIVRLMRKIGDMPLDKKEKKLLLSKLKAHQFVSDFDSKRAKRYISYKRYLAIFLLKHSMYGFLLRLLNHG